MGIKKFLSWAGIFIIWIFFSSCSFPSAQHLFFKARKLYDQGAYLEAIRNWEMILSQSPRSKWADDALHWIGITYYVELDLPERAVDTFSRLVRNYPDSIYAPQDQALIAEILRARGEYARALVEYYRYIKLFPEHPRTPQVWYQLITCLFEIGEYQTMRTQANNFLKKHPNSPFADDCIFWIGESYFLQGKFDQAKQYFQSYLEKYPQGDFYLNSGINLARCYEEEGELGKAIEHYLQLQTRFPSNQVLNSRLEAVEKRYQKKYGRKYRPPSP